MQQSSTAKPPDDRECAAGTEQAGKASACAGCPNQNACASGSASGETKAEQDHSIAVKNRMAQIKHKILVLSGKGGVGKSTFSAQLAFALALQGKQVGLLDIDICGPSIPRMLGLVGHEVHQSASGWSPVYVEDNLAVMSIGFMLPSNDDAVIWRGPRKNGLIKQFLSDVVWGELDYLIIDTPPGTSDEHISIVQYLKGTHIDGAVVITTPQEISMSDVRKELNFCKKTGLKVLGVVENMSDIKVPFANILDPESGLKLVSRTGEYATPAVIERIRSACPELFEYYLESALFKVPTIDTTNEATPFGMARKFNVPYLGKLPMDPNMMKACEEGKSFLEVYPTSAGAQPFADIVRNITDNCRDK